MKYVWIEGHRDQYSVARMCRQLEVSRTGYCQWRQRRPSERSVANAALDVHIAAVHENSKRSYGRPRVVRGLRDGGIQSAIEASFGRTMSASGLLLRLHCPANSGEGGFWRFLAMAEAELPAAATWTILIGPPLLILSSRNCHDFGGRAALLQ